MGETVIEVVDLKKQYRLGTIGGGTLTHDIQSWWARKRGKEDPNLMLGQDYRGGNETFWALNGINLKVEKGEALGIIGANGAGKSTLLKILSRVTAPTEGEVRIQGRISSMLEVGTGFHKELTGRENIYMNGAILGMSKKEVDAKIDDIIEFSECSQFIDTPVKRYSSGMYVKLAFAVAAHLDSEILVMDEVLAVGDMKFQKKCLGKMGDVAEKEGRTVLYVSHNMETIRNLCSRCIVLANGRIQYDGDVETAIQIYLDSGKSELQTKFCFTDYRRSNYDLAKKALITNVELENKKLARYASHEKMHIKAKWEAYDDIEKLKFGLSIKYVDLSNVGFTEMQETFDTRGGTKYEHVIELDLSSLAEGTYFFYLQLLVQDDLRVVHGIDQVDKICFEVVDTNSERCAWQRQYWGNIRFKELAIVGETVERK